jgi:hypothetical protein
MSIDRRLLALSTTTLLWVVACTGSPTPSPEPASIGPSAPASSAPSEPAQASSVPSATGEPSAIPDPSEEPSGAVLGQAWAVASLTDVTTGETFRIADLVAPGRTIFVEAMAIWCTKCRAQQVEFTAALERLDPADVAYVVLTVDPSESAAELARYEAERAFHGMYAVAGPDVSRALEEEFGPTVLNPPSVPVIVIDPDGTVRFETGQHSAEDIVATVES